jgi:hypothetical protein
MEAATLKRYVQRRRLGARKLTVWLDIAVSVVEHSEN